jgi:integrase
LKWAQVDLDNNIVRLESDETKNNEARTVYLDDELKTVFLNQKERQK